MASSNLNSQLPPIASLTNGMSQAQRSPQQLSPDSHPNEPPRDSGHWTHSSSKHNSANSQGLHVSTLLNPDDSPPRASVPTTPQSARIPNSAQSIGSQLPSINQGFHDAGNRASADSGAYAAFDSRRSSVDSRIHQGFSGLHINPPANPTSPYESANTSQVSLAASLRRPTNAQGMSPIGSRSGQRGPTAPRIAPPIVPPRVQNGPDPNAARPTPGFAWAFPDSSTIPEESRAGSDSGDSSVSRGPSRQNSFAASSVRSSIFSTDSHLPPGQRRFEDDPTTHHHSMQHRAIQNLQSETSAAQAAGNYSRTPELRVSHKLAERKRRSEMKDLFEELNKAVPSNGGAKASKWEILTKAIDYIRSAQQNERTLSTQVDRLHREADYGRDAQKENDMLRTEVQVMHQHLRRLDPSAPHVYGHFTSQLSQQGPSTNGNPSISLPPLQSGGPPAPGSSQGQFGNMSQAPVAMEGVAYGNFSR